jgi:hypothetical protein
MRRAIVAVALLTIGCSAAPGQAALEDAVRAYSDAYLSDDAVTAWEMLSERCRDRLGRSEFSSIVSLATDLYGDAQITSLTVDDRSGSLARVTYRFDVGELDQEREPWVFEDDEWRIDDC